MAGSTLVLNPIFARELRGRWRTWMAPVVVLLYSGILAFITFEYWSLVTGGNQDFVITGVPSLGRRLMGAIVPWQMAFWVMAAPLISCGVIAREREKHMLEGVVLSGLSPSEIILGYWFSVLAYQLILLLIPLPIFLAALFLGGISPAEIVMLVALQASTAALSASFGLLCSSWCMTAQRAFGLTVAMGSIIWVFLAVSLLSPGASPAYLHPALAAATLFSDSPHPGAIAMALLSLVAGAFYLWAMVSMGAGAIAVTPVSAGYSEFGSATYRPSSTAPAAAAAPATPEVTPASEEAQKPVRPARPVPPGRLPRRSIAEFLPLFTPIGRRELRVRFRWQENVYADLSSGAGLPSLPTIGLTCIFAAIVHPLFVSFLPSSQLEDFRRVVALFSVPAVVIAACFFGVLAAQSFTREREQDTLSETLLSPLSSWQLVAGFLEAAFWAIFGIIPLVWIVAPLSMLVFPPDVVVLAVFAIGVTLLLSAGVGAFLSWIGEHTTVACSGTLAFIVGYSYFVLSGRTIFGSDTFLSFWFNSPWCQGLWETYLEPFPLGVKAQLTVFTGVHALLALLLLCLVTTLVHLKRREASLLKNLRLLFLPSG